MDPEELSSGEMTEPGTAGPIEGRRPFIGVTTSELRKAQTVSPTPEGEPPLHEMALGLKYLQAIELAGGIPVVIPPMEIGLIGDLLANFDGLCLSGGPDIHPGHYGAEPHRELGPTAPDLDRFELAVALRADAMKLPIFAICRGMQTLNVSRGGTLLQHIPDRWRTIDHRQKTPGRMASHHVDLDRESRVSDIVGDAVVDVNSFHHQAIDELGDELVATGWAPDGAIEAIEDPGERFVLGVQWHAELMVDEPRQLELFRRFVMASASEAAAPAGEAR